VRFVVNQVVKRHYLVSPRVRRSAQRAAAPADSPWPATRFSKARFYVDFGCASRCTRL
jgi:hypothetical protein